MMLTCQFHGGRTGDDGLLIFCGAPASLSSSYCATHRPRIWSTDAQIRAARAARAPHHVDRLATFKRGDVNG